MIRLAATLILLVIATCVSARDWRTDPERSTLGFAGSAQGERFTGTFARFEPSIRFDPSDLSTARFDVRIDLASADTQNDERDQTLKGSDFFAVKTHPQARFLAESFRALADGRYAADGELSLRGLTRPVTLVFSWRPGTPAVIEGEAVLEGESQVERLDFELGTGDWADPDTIAHEVSVFTRLFLSPID